MELPRRTRGDELLKPGELTALRERLRIRAPDHDLTTVIACAFDHRTRMLPFIYRRHAHGPGGRAGHRLGHGRCRVRQDPHRPPAVEPQLPPVADAARRPHPGPVHGLEHEIHSEQCMELIRDACRIDPAHRPLIIAGGPHAVYEPWDLFSADPATPWRRRRRRHRRGVRPAEPAGGAAVDPRRGRIDALGVPPRARQRRARRTSPAWSIRAATGRASPRNWSTRASSGCSAISTSCRTRCWATGCSSRPAGTRPSGARALPADQVQRHSPISSLVLTFGCKFACPYCPIPAYNQRQHRVKSGERIADEMWRLNDEYGLRYFFGTDDNFFNDKARTLRDRRDAGPRAVRRRAAPQTGALGHRGDRPRHARR